MAKQAQTLKTGNKQAVKPGKAIVRTELSDALNDLCEKFAFALCEVQSLSEELGGIAREAAPHIADEETLGVFIGGCAELCELSGLKSGSLKVYLSNLRGVLRAMLDGWAPAADCVTLRAMYDAIPADMRGKGANKGNTAKRGARQTQGGAAVPGTGVTVGADGKARNADGTPAPTAADARKAAIVALFGFHTAELEDAVAYAAEHSGIFQTWAKASARAAQQVTPLRKAA